MQVTKEILQKLREIYPKPQLVIFWDSAGWHRGSVVENFVQEDQNIELIYFPRYAPEETPQEHVWKNGRSQIPHNRFMQDIDAATDEFVDDLNSTRSPYSLLGFSPNS